MKFYPQGVNWVCLGKSKEKWPPNISFNDSYFHTSHQEVLTSLNEISRLGYNVVRVRIDALSISGPSDRPALNPSYVNNLIDFIRMANNAHLYVLLTGQWLPKNYYGVAAKTQSPHTQHKTSGLNQLLLSEGLITAFGVYESDLVKSIQEQAPELMSGIFAFDLWNELYFDSIEKPFSDTNGTFVSESGSPYNLGSAESRQKLADDATLNWVNKVSESIKRIDPQLLTTSSVFTPLEVQRSGYTGVLANDSKNHDPRQPFRLQVLNRSNLDYLQIHPYPHSANYDMKSDLESLEYFEFKKLKPVLVGEFGIYKKDFRKTWDAISIARSYVSQVCRYQLAGWLYWTWDTVEQPYLWNMKDEGGAIARAISPTLHPQCEPFSNDVIEPPLSRLFLQPRLGEK